MLRIPSPRARRFSDICALVVMLTSRTLAIPLESQMFYGSVVENVSKAGAAESRLARSRI